MRVQRQDQLSDLLRCEHWCIAGDPLPPPSGPRFKSPTAYAYYVTGWSVLSSNDCVHPLDPTKADA